MSVLYIRVYPFLLVITVFLSSCGGSSTSTSLDAPSLSMTVDVKQFKFNWNEVSGAEYYKLLENPDGIAGFTQVGRNITDVSYSHVVPLYARFDAGYILSACNASGCVNSDTLWVDGNLAQGVGYIKASNTDPDDRFGWSMASSADGRTLAVSGAAEDGGDSGINGDQADNSTVNAGAVYIFTRSGGNWAQTTYLKASNAGENDNFGYSLSLSDSGDTLAVGAYRESSSATGVDGDQSDNSAVDAGAAYVFVRQAGVWSQQAYLKASNTDEGDRFGTAVSISGDGNTLAVGAEREGGGATGINGDQNDNSAQWSGAAYIFTRSDSIWSQKAYIKASNAGGGDHFGYSLALSNDGRTLAVGAYGESSNSAGINGDQSDDSSFRVGAAYVFSFHDGGWSQQAYIKSSNPKSDDLFGMGLDLSGDGNVLAVGAKWEDSASTGVGGDDENDGDNSSGAVFLFERTDTLWSQSAFIKSSNSEGYDNFGSNVALSDDGVILVCGAYGEDSGSTGVNGDQSDNSVGRAGAAYVFNRTGGVWSQQAYLKATNPGEVDFFATNPAISGDGNTIALGAHTEDSAGEGLGADQLDNSAPDAGAVYIY